MATTGIFNLVNSRQSPFQTRQALIVLGLQKNFLSTDTSSQSSGDGDRALLERIALLVHAFRENGGDIYWVRVRPPNAAPSATLEALQRNARSEPGFETTSTAPDLGTSTGPNQTIHRHNSQAAFQGGGSGALHENAASQQHDDGFLAEAVALQLPGDVHIVGSAPSAFEDTALLTTLRMQLVTEVYIVGFSSHSTVMHTACDAVQHGLQLNLVEDCLGYTAYEDHVKALQYMSEDMGAYTTTCSTLLTRFGLSVEVDDTPTWEDMPEAAPAATLSAPAEDALSTTSLQIATAANTLTTERKYWRPDQHSRFSAAVPPWSGGDHEDNLRGASSFEAEPMTPLTVDGMGGPVWPQMTANSASEAISTTGSAHVSQDTSLSSNHVQMDIPPSTLMRIPEARSSKKRRSADIDEVYLTPPTYRHHDTHTKPQELVTKLSVRKKSKFESLATHTIKLPDDAIGGGDSYITYDLLDSRKAETMLDRLFSEVRWQTMSHATGVVPRLVCCQGSIDRSTGAMPIYRHPSDTTLPLMHWSSAVLDVREAAQAAVGHELNHVLIQLYRGGNDHISEHSDKTLDIVRGSKIVNVSFGAKRTMRLRSKRRRPHDDHVRPPAFMQNGRTGAWSEPEWVEPATDRVTERIAMPHNSIFVLGPETNAKFLHGIQPDKRLPHDLGEAEMAFGGYRISLTFRLIGTFVSHDSTTIWGQGATSKSSEAPARTVNGNLCKSQELLNAFGTENQEPRFDWDKTYGQGFDVLNLKGPVVLSDDLLVFLTGDDIEEETLLLYMQALRKSADLVASPLLDTPSRPSQMLHGTRDSSRRPICIRDNDRQHTQTLGLDASLLYLDRLYDTTEKKPAQVARQMELMAGRLLQSLRLTLCVDSGDACLAAQEALSAIETELRLTELASASSLVYAAGQDYGLIDCALFPYTRRLQGRVSRSWFSSHCPLTAAWTFRVQSRLKDDMA